MIKIAYAFGALVALTLSADAADLGKPTSLKDPSSVNMATITEPTTARTFAGFSVGGSLNYDRLDVDHAGSADWSACRDVPGGNCVANDLNNYFDTETDSIAGKLPGMDGEGISGGVRASYMFQVGRVYGGPVLMADFGEVEAKLSHHFTDGDIEDPETYATGKLSVGSDWRVAFVGKGGIAVTDRIGVYGLAGVGFVDLGVSGSVGGPVVEDFTKSSSVNVMSYDETVTAFVFGAGVDLKLTNNLALFAEWNRYDLDSFGGSKAVDCFTFTHDGDANLDVARVGLTYTFN